MLTSEEKKQYERQIQIKEFGIKNQLILKNSKVAVIGIGGTGVPATISLATMGIGSITIFDHDIIEKSNLNRSILFDINDLKRKKVEVVSKKIKDINPYISVNAIDKYIDENNIGSYISNYDCVLCLVDNWKSRYVINEFCYSNHTPFIWGAFGGHEASLTFIDPLKNTPCLKCIFPSVMTKDYKSLVLSPLAGIVGMYAAYECFKYLFKIENLLRKTLITFHGLEGYWSICYYDKNPRCSLCSK